MKSSHKHAFAGSCYSKHTNDKIPGYWSQLTKQTLCERNYRRIQSSKRESIAHRPSHWPRTMNGTQYTPSNPLEASQDSPCYRHGSLSGFNSAAANDAGELSMPQSLPCPNTCDPYPTSSAGLGVAGRATASHGTPAARGCVYCFSNLLVYRFISPRLPTLQAWLPPTVWRPDWQTQARAASPAPAPTHASVHGRNAQCAL